MLVPYRIVLYGLSSYRSMETAMTYKRPYEC